MLNKIEGRYNMRKKAKAFVLEATEMVERYGWQDMVVHPYSNCPMKVAEIIDRLNDYDLCTEGSKEYLIQLANGLVDILNAWEEYELQPKVKVRSLKGGKIHEVTPDFAEILIKDGLAEAI